VTFAAAIAVLLLSMGQSSVPDPLELARRLYNEQRYEEAIRLADEARQTPALAHPAAIVFARAHLERFRLLRDREALSAAREALKTVDASGLNSRDRVELLIALGETLYLDDESTLDDRFSAAAEQFEVALAHAEVLDVQGRDLLFDWWAGALDRQAQQGPESARGSIYARILARAEAELERDPGAVSPSYWLAAAAGGTSDTARAVGAASAGWVRAGALGEPGLTLRADLDRLMRQVILPERARELATGADPRPTLVLLERQWTQFKEKWAR
jgi:tetratricopeptide (TPR) repeat protein